MPTVHRFTTTASYLLAFAMLVTSTVLLISDVPHSNAIALWSSTAVMVLSISLNIVFCITRRWSYTLTGMLCGSFAFLVASFTVSNTFLMWMYLAISIAMLTAHTLIYRNCPHQHRATKLHIHDIDTAFNDTPPTDLLITKKGHATAYRSVMTRYSLVTTCTECREYENATHFNKVEQLSEVEQELYSQLDLADDVIDHTLLTPRNTRSFIPTAR